MGRNDQSSLSIMYQVLVTKRACHMLFYMTYNCRTSLLNSHFNEFLNCLKLSLPHPLLAQLAISVSTTFGHFVHFADISH